MVTKKIRSEYMKKFKDPKWETYTRCYEEMLKYRLTRRLLEHTHNPWFWCGSDSDSESGGRSPTIPSKNQVQSETTRPVPDAELEDGQQEQQTNDRSTGPVPRLLLQEEQEEEQEEDGTSGQAAGSQLDGAREARAPEEEREEQRPSSRDRKQNKQLSDNHRERDQERGSGRQRKPSRPSKKSRQSQQVRPSPPRQPKERSKESRHPFALYGSGEKDADIAGRKTHNVGPAASTNEIHESALRAKTRRQVERQVQTQRSERRRAKSADLDKVKKVGPPEFNPWLTEYMRCFSARSR